MKALRLKCPACGNALFRVVAGLHCADCKLRYDIIDGFPILLLDPSLDTALDIAEYDEMKPLSPERSASTYSYYKEIIEKRDIKGGACLEIGAGSGNLTYSLVHSSPFDMLYCSDISQGFLKRLRKWVVPEAGKRVEFLIFDAGSIPFEDGSIRAVFGHSVLHHLLQYEKVIEDVYRVLEPGGVAIFGDPIMDFYAPFGLVVELIFKFESLSQKAGFNEAEMQLLRGVARQPPTIGRKMRESREDLAAQEDKHLFLIEEMRELSKRIGFSEFHYRNAYHPTNLGYAMKFALQSRFRYFKADETKIDAYDFVFQSVTDVYAAALGEHVCCDFGFLTFIK